MVFEGRHQIGGRIYPASVAALEPRLHRLPDLKYNEVAEAVRKVKL